MGVGCKTCSSSDILMGIFNSRNKQAEDDEDFSFKDFSPFPQVQQVPRQDTSTEDISSTSFLLTVGTAFIVANVLLAVALAPKRYKLENDDRCGIATGGEAECYFDCVSTKNRVSSVRLIKNLGCLEDCFDSKLGKRCLRGLIDDVERDGVCNVGSETGINPGAGVYTANSSCGQYSANPLDPNISKGTCRKETEDELITDECQQFITRQPPIIMNTATELISSACTKEVSARYVEKKVTYDSTTCGCTQEQFSETTAELEIPVIPTEVDLPPFPWLGKRKGLRQQNVPKNGTLPIRFGFKGGNIELEAKFDYTHTRNRYSWICSLRSSALNADHFCAVTLLSLPPKPTVIVGAAHCTFLCKNGKHRIDSCCCRTDSTDCSDDVAKCGNDPKVKEMEPTDAEILCGEWETGPTPPSLSEEKENIVLTILDIKRHPKFNTEKGPIAGNDIAVFKIDDKKIRNNPDKRKNLNPVCFSNQELKRQTGGEDAPSGIHAGWTAAPPLTFLTRYAPAYVPLYREFFKQWHYRMDILVKCQDPIDSAFGVNLTCPSNTAYPAATICAKDSANTACFSSGESGSPLMEKDELDRFHATGLLSFVKGRGCDIYSNNPSAYTKLSCFLPWIAAQYGMDYEPEEDSDPSSCSQETPGSISTDKNCTVLEGANAGKEKCQNIPSSLQGQFAGERDCIFPFYYNGKKYDHCIIFTEAGFVYPVFRCPIYNITTKRDGISDYTIEIDTTETEKPNKYCPGFACQVFQTKTYCAVDPKETVTELDPSIECALEKRRAPFSVCKNNCPGVGSLGVIGGGALLFTATSLAGTGLLAALGGLGAVGLPAVGLAASQTDICMCPFCSSPFCCTRFNQRCRLQRVSGRLRCPTRC